MKDLKQQITDLKEMKAMLANLNDAVKAVSQLWSDSDFDFNEVSTSYPFEKSFDELQVWRWKEDTSSQIELRIAILEYELLGGFKVTVLSSKAGTTHYINAKEVYEDSFQDGDILLMVERLEDNANIYLIYSTKGVFSKDPFYLTEERNTYTGASLVELSPKIEAAINSLFGELKGKDKKPNPRLLGAEFFPVTEPALISFEAQPVRQNDFGVEGCEPQDAEFWSVYSRHQDGRAMCIANLKTESEATSLLKLLKSSVRGFQPELSTLSTEDIWAELQRRGVIRASWCVDDIIAHAKDMDVEITDDEAKAIAGDIERHHDATIGINWDVIGDYIHNYLNANTHKVN